MFFMTDVTRILNQIDNGDPSAADKLIPLVYEELRALARQRLSNEKPGQTLDATALVHEAYLRLIGCDKDLDWDNRGHFFAAAAESMRRILVEIARRKQSVKHGGDRQRVDLDAVFPLVNAAPDALLAFEEAFSNLEREEPEKAQLVKLRYNAGCSLNEAAAAMNISRATAKRYWSFSRAWLFDQLTE